MKAEIINIGDELLLGQVFNTNASRMAHQLYLAGIKVYQITTISDNKQHILSALAEAECRADIILITGGLGPTKDDITKNALCEYFNTSLVFNETVYNDIKELLSIRGIKVSEINKAQAEVPAICTPVSNKNGTAPGMWFVKDNKVFISMPGVPFEMEAMMSNYVIPMLAEQFETDSIVYKTVLTQGIGESFLSEIIENWENKLPAHIKLAYLPSPGMVRLRLTATGDDKIQLVKEIDKQIFCLNKIIPDYIFGYDDETLEGIVGNLLKHQDKTFSTAESCSGGYIAHLVTGIPGSSLYYKGSVVAYANEIKIQQLGVNPRTLEQYGAVSEQVVTEMAKGVKNRFNTDYTVATSGIAGPDGGTDEKPVGTTWIAVATPHKIIAVKYLFGESRERNIHKTAVTALNMLRKELIR